MSDSKECKFKYLAWFFAPLPLFLPLLWINWVTMWASTDSLFYTNVLAMMSDAMKSGDILPRWLSEANNGFGSPVMMFYAPFAYIVTAIINLPLSPLHLDVVTQFLIGIYASQVVSGYFAFLWLKHNFSRNIALTGSLLFVLLPYKFVYIYGHANLAQLWALAFLPLWMLAAEKLLQGKTRHIGIYALVFAAVYYAHPLTVLAFGAVPAAYVLWFGREKWRVNYSSLVIANALGLAICTAQWLPEHYAFTWIHPEEFLAGRFNWRNNLYHIDTLLWGYYGLIALIGVEMWQNPQLRPQMHTRVGMMWLIVMAIVVFLTEPVSSFVWENVKLLQYLQFPCARLHACMLMAVVYLLCSWLTYYDTLTQKASLAYNKKTMVTVVLAFTVVTLIYLYHVNTAPNDLNAKYLEEMHAARIIPSPEYKTHWNCIVPSDVYRMRTQHSVPEPVAVSDGDAAISSLAWQPPSSISFTADVKSRDADIIVRQCYLPPWVAYDEKGQSISLMALEKNNGLIGFTLPQGNHTVSLHFRLSRVERTARIISLIALLLSIGFLFLRKKPN